MSLTLNATEAIKRLRKRQLENKPRLAGLWQDNDLVFTTTTGMPLNPEGLTRRFLRPLLERVGLPHIRFHDLRHTFATILLSRGTHPKVVQEMLGLREHLPDDGHLLSRASRYAGRCCKRVGEYPIRAGCSTVAVNRPGIESGPLFCS